MRVLVVDDNETNRKLLRAQLAANQIGTVVATDGVEALEALEREQVDVIVSDILMPNMDGFRLCFEVKHNHRMQNVGVILYTATDFTLEDERRAFDLGADRFLKKHGSAAAIVSAINETAQEVANSTERNVSHCQEYPELQVMKEYNQAMILKLENKSIELERAQDKLKELNEALEQRVRDRTGALEVVNRELEAFSYSVSHDLRAPLRWIDSYADMLEKEESARLSPAGRDYLGHIRSAQRRMSQLTEDLLGLARVTQVDMHWREVDLTRLAKEVTSKFCPDTDQASETLRIEPGMKAVGDESLLRLALENLFDNAWKYSSKQARRQIEFGCFEGAKGWTYFVRDNGAGFDMQYAGRLFSAFQRLHSETEFPGVGVGLATVQRIIHRHDGKIWAESSPGLGATFYFAIGQSPVS